MAATTRQTRNKKNRSQDEEMSRAEDSDEDVTPSASFITARNWNSEPTELPTELDGWKIYTINEKSTKMKLHADFLKICIEEDIPKGLTVDLTSTLEDKDNEIFNNKWKQISKNCKFVHRYVQRAKVIFKPEFTLWLLIS